MVEKKERDYRLNGAESILAIQNGLADATWSTSPVEKNKMRELLVRKNEAPIKSHISYLFETLETNNKVSFWYGVCRKSDIYYHEYFEKLASENDNFSFHITLSEPGEKDNWKSHTGFIQKVVEQEFFSNKGEFNNMEFYLYGPPAMVESTNDMLQKIGISKNHISFDAY